MKLDVEANSEERSGEEHVQSGSGAAVEVSKNDGNQQTNAATTTYVGCTLLWVGVALLLAVVYCLIWLPRAPRVSLEAAQLSALPGVGGASPAPLPLRLSLLFLVSNPNRQQLRLDGLGFGSVDFAGQRLAIQPIAPRHVASQSVFPLAVQLDFPRPGAADVEVNVTVTVNVSGRLNLLGLFSQHATSASACNVTLSRGGDDILGYTCQQTSDLR